MIQIAVPAQPAHPAAFLAAATISRMAHKFAKHVRPSVQLVRRRPSAQNALSMLLKQAMPTSAPIPVDRTSTGTSFPRNAKLAIPRALLAMDHMPSRV